MPQADNTPAIFTYDKLVNSGGAYKWVEVDIAYSDFVSSCIIKSTRYQHGGYGWRQYDNEQQETGDAGENYQRFIIRFHT